MALHLTFRRHGIKCLSALVPQCLISLLAIATAGELSGPPAFTKKPTATRAGDPSTGSGQGKVTIEFAVDRETDVAVFLEDGAGKVVRHLVAGVLGKNPPPPLKPGLAQSVEWDGKADYGKLPPSTSHPPPFRVRVALGLGAKYDKILIDDPQSLGGINSLVAGPDGTLYVLHGTGGTMSGSEAGAGGTIRAYGRDGKYLRTVLPFSADLPIDKVKSLPVLELDGRPQPVNSQVFGGIYPGGGTPRKAGMGITPDGVVLRMLASGHLAAVDGKTGAIPWGSYLGGALPGRPGDRACVAVASDGKSAFVGGLGKAAVYRVKLPERAGGELFFGDAGKGGTGEGQLGAAGARGLAVDGKGHVLISDSANNRVLVVGESDGKPAGSFEVRGPESLGVDPATGAVYVLADGGRSVVKFTPSTNSGPGGGWKDAKEVARLPIDPGGNGSAVMTVDAGAKPVIVWVGTDGARLFRIEDAGGKLSGRNINAGSLGSAAFLDMTVDRYRPEREIYVRSGGGGSFYWRVSDETGKVEKFSLQQGGGGFSGINVVPAPDGNLYGVGWPLYFVKHDRSGKVLPWQEPDHRDFPKTDGFGGKWAPTQSYVPVSMGAQPHTIGVRGSDGHIFIMEPAAPGGRPPKMMREYLPTGKLVFETPVVWKVSDAALGPRFDAAGNIYIADIVRPMDWPYPPEFNAVFPKIEINKTRPEGAQDATAFSYGSIVKFSPKGGIIDYRIGSDHAGVTLPAPYKGELKLDPGLESMDVAWYGGRMFRGPEKVIGAEWVHPGISHIGVFYCNCENVSFDVDEFGRVFFPDTDLHVARVIDTAGNAITRLGGYGNADDGGEREPTAGQASSSPTRPTPLAPRPICFARLVSVGATDRHLYFGDSMNRRLLRAKITYAAEETVAVP